VRIKINIKMKKQLSLYTLLISLLFFSACTEDDVNQDCFTCETTATEYCINESDNFYTVTVDGISTEILLANELWADIRAQLVEECENPTETECFACNDSGTEYCYTTGDDFYTVEITGQDAQPIPLNDNSWAFILSSAREFCTDSIVDCYTCESEDITYCYTEGDDFYTVGNLADDCDGDNTPDYLDSDTCDSEEQILLEDQTWEEIKTQLETDCPIIEQDCYTCVSENTEYCYIEGNDFYTATNSGDATDILLNGQTWDEVKIQLENDCPSSITASIVGNWKINNFYGTTISNVTIAGETTTIESVQTAITHEAFVTFTENPNEYTGSGFITIESETDGQITTYETSPFDNGTWILDSNELTLDEQENSSIVTLLTDTTLTLLFQQTSTTEDGGVVTETILDFTQSYTRQ